MSIGLPSILTALLLAKLFVVNIEMLTEVRATPAPIGAVLLKKVLFTMDIFEADVT